MKRNISLMIVLVFLGTQQFFGQKFRVGITSGLNVSTLSEPGNLYDNAELKTGFGGGLALRYAVSESFCLQSGTIYEQKGFRNKQDLTEGEKDLTGTYNYITIPLLAEGSMIIKGSTRLYGVTGFYAGFKTFAENAVVLPEEDWTDEATDDNIRSEDCGWIIGGGVQVPAGTHLMQIGFKYSLGFSEVQKSVPDYRNKSVLFGVTFFF